MGSLKHGQSTQWQKEKETATMKELKSAAFERWTACSLIKNSDQEKCGSIVNGLISQCSLGNDQCPKTLLTATDALANHRFDKRKPRGNNNGNTRSNQEAARTTIMEWSINAQRKDSVLLLW
jgi:hypothetical protein